VSAATTLGITACVVGMSVRPATALRASLLVVLMLTDLWMLAWGLVSVRPAEEIYAVSPSVRYLEEHKHKHGRVLDRDWKPAISTSPLGTGTPLALRHRLEPVRGYEPLDVQRYKEYLQLIGDRDAPLRAGENFTMPALIDFDIRNLSLLDLLGVKYILQPAQSTPASPSWEPVLNDPSPVAYEMSAEDTAGIHKLPPYVLYR